MTRRDEPAGDRGEGGGSQLQAGDTGPTKPGRGKGQFSLRASEGLRAVDTWGLAVWSPDRGGGGGGSVMLCPVCGAV